MQKTMTWVTGREADFVDQSIIEKIAVSGEMSRQQHFRLTSALLNNLWMSNEERQKINQVFDYIQTGRVRLVD